MPLFVAKRKSFINHKWRSSDQIEKYFSSPPNCTDHPDAPGCGPSPSPSFCDLNPKFCRRKPDLLCDIPDVTTPADPALAKAVDRRQEYFV